MKLLIYAMIVPVLLFTLTTGCKKDNNGSNTPKDADGYVYRTVKIGTQIWMAENLRTTHYRNGDVIPNVSDKTTWVNQTTGACHDYPATADATVYGKFYNWYAVNDPRNIAPKGWHIPSNAEWTAFANLLDGLNSAGFKLKEAGTAHWLAPNNANNETGFTALPGGVYPGSFIMSMNQEGAWYSVTNNGSEASAFHAEYSNTKVSIYPEPKYLGVNVRCIKD